MFYTWACPRRPISTSLGFDWDENSYLGPFLLVSVHTSLLHIIFCDSPKDILHGSDNCTVLPIRSNFRPFETIPRTQWSIVNWHHCWENFLNLLATIGSHFLTLIKCIKETESYLPRLLNQLRFDPLGWQFWKLEVPPLLTLLFWKKPRVLVCDWAEGTEQIFLHYYSLLHCVTGLRERNQSNLTVWNLQRLFYNLQQQLA